jgi:hypothetical protein
MAAGLGFKDFVTGEVLTAADVDGYLMQGTWVFASAAARTSAVTSPQEGNMSYLKDTNSVEYYTGSAWVAVGGGGGGKVLQVVQGTTTTSTTVSSTTYTDTTVTATITPAAATSKILVLTSLQAYLEGTGVASKFYAQRLMRGATNIYNDNTFYSAGGYSVTNLSFAARTSIVYLDSPSTTSATTYKIQAAADSASGFVGFQYTGATSSIILIEIGA